MNGVSHVKRNKNDKHPVTVLKVNDHGVTERSLLSSSAIPVLWQVDQGVYPFGAISFNRVIEGQDLVTGKVQAWIAALRAIHQSA